MPIVAPISHQFLTEADQAVLRSAVAGITQSGHFHIEANGSIYALPPYAAQKVVSVLDSLAEGQGVTIIPDQAELTVAQAAEILDVPEECVIGLCCHGVLEYRQDGDRYWIDRDQLVKYEAVRRWKLEGLNEITRESQEMGLYDMGPYNGDMKAHERAHNE